MEVAAKTAAVTPAAQQPAASPAYKHIRPESTNAQFLAKLAKSRKLAGNLAATKSAAEKIGESEKAQTTPIAESRALSNQGQVADLQTKKIEPASENEAKNILAEGIRSSVPASLKSMDEFKESGKGKKIGKTVMAKVSGDVGNVKAGFGSISVAKPPAPADKGTALPPMEQAQQTEEINPGARVVPAIEKQVLDNTAYLNKSDDLLKQEEISQEQLDMVDKGDLANANKERQNLNKEATAQPAAVQQMAATEHKILNAEMHAEEKNVKADMQKTRQNQLTETGSKQEQAKIDLEKKREEVAQNINKRYEACQRSITEKLDALEKNSLVQFDTGQAKATKEFEDQVSRDINKFKDRRYDRFGGSLLWLKDKLFGIDDFPEVKQAFDTARAAFVANIDTLIATITKANNEVIAACKKELEDTKTAIAIYVATLGPLLREVGKKAQEEVGKKLQALGADIDKRREKLQEKLADKRKAAMEAIDKKIEAMKASMSGALSIIGNLLLEALKKFFKWALEKLGIDAEGFFNTLAKMGAAIKAMFKSPGKFFSNLIAAIKGSINDFRANFKTYIISALADWLTGAMGSAGIEIPKEFTVRSVIGMLMQVLGLSWAFLRGKLVAHIGEQKVAWAEKTVDVVKKFVTGGVAALWDWIKDQASSIKDMFIQGTKDWLLTTLVTKFVEWVASLLIPGGAILRLVQGIYNLVMWFVNNIQKILRWVNAVLDSLGNVAMGAISAAIGFIVNGMKIIIPVILDFFARLLNVSGIVDAVKKIIDKIAAPIHAAINKVIDWVVGWVKKMFGKEDKAETKKGTEERNKQAKEDNVIGEVVPFKAGKENHSIWIEMHGSSPVVMVASEKEQLTKKLKRWKETEKGKDPQNASLISEADSKLAELNNDAVTEDVAQKKTEGKEESARERSKAEAETKKDEQSLASILAILFTRFEEAYTIEVIPVKMRDLIKAEYISGMFLANVDKVAAEPENQVQYTFKYTKLNDRTKKNSFAEFMHKWNGRKIEIVNNYRKYLIENRPPFKAGLRDQVWDIAVIRSFNAGTVGRIFDANNRTIELSKDGKWDMGHKPGYEYRDLVDDLINGNIDWDGFISEYNVSSRYQPEDPSENRSHKHENK